MKNVFLAFLIIAISRMASAHPPSELLVQSCLQYKAISPSTSVHPIDAHGIAEEDDYANGFNATYLFNYKGKDVGYAEGKNDQALIYTGELYRLSSATPLGDNHDIKPNVFNPYLALWSIGQEEGKRYLCVSFNFDGLGRSGNFQKVHGGYLLDTQSKTLYFAVRYLPN